MRLSTKQIALNGIVAGLYAAVTILTASFAYGPVQFRIADALCLLVGLCPGVTVGLTVGCLIANLFSTVSLLDIVIGSAATLLGCLLTQKLRSVWLLPIPTVLCNAVLVGTLLAFTSTGESGFFPALALYGAQVAVGETVVLYVLGVPLYLAAERSGFLQRLLRK